MPLSRTPDDAVYLDHAAATPLDPEVAAAMDEAAAIAYGNPSSPHAAGRAAKRILEDAREQLLQLIGGRVGGTARDRLVFTSGATEANRLGVVGLAGSHAARQAAGTVAISARDHSSLGAAATELGGLGWQVCELPLVGAGTVDFASAPARAEAPATRILTTTTVCGQTGIRDDLAWVARLATDGWLVHADATQAAAWDEIAFAAGPWATLALAAHKFGGPRGIGGLVVRHGITLAPVAAGPQELGLRGGTEPVSLAVGFARALGLAAATRAAAAARISALRERLERGILAAAHAAGIEAIVVGAQAPRAPHVALIALAGLDRQAVAMAADLAGVCLATGTACASGSAEPPAILGSLRLPDRFQRGAIRLSLARTTTTTDIDRAVARLEAVFRRLGATPSPGSDRPTAGIGGLSDS
jgi:cysteine desulfurase